MKKQTGFVFLALLITLGILAVLALGIGSTYIPPGQILEGFFKENRMARVIVVGLRLPRVLLAIMIGMALSLAGALLQAVMRNPLADPGIIGVSAGAAAAATSVMLLFPRWLSLVPLVAFVGALFACVLIYLMAWRRGIDPVRIVLSGVAVNTVLGAYTSFLQLLNSDNLANVLGFLNGSLSGRSWGHVETVAIYVSIGTVLAFFAIRGANLLQLGDDVARSLGVDVNKTRILLSALGAFLAAATVAVAGMIGFVGLVVPHMARMLVGPNYKDLVPVAAVMGSVTLLLADTVGRMLVPGMEIPVGVIMAMTGGPFFLYMLRRKRF